MTRPFTRFEIELEFVQCLANPFYINFLAHSKVLDDPRFVSYIDYLQYFRKPEYIRLLTYPVYSLSALTLLQQPQFRADAMGPGLARQVLDHVVAEMKGEKGEKRKGEEEEEGEGGRGEGGDGSRAEGSNNVS